MPPPDAGLLNGGLCSLGFSSVLFGRTIGLARGLFQAAQSFHGTDMSQP